jgi:nitrilase
MSACQFLTRADMAEDLAPIQGDDPDTILIRGGSCVVSPLGEVIAGPVYGAKKMLTVEIDRGQLAEARFDLDVVGHYARPDVFTLLADETPRTARTPDVDADPIETEET